MTDYDYWNIESQLLVRSKLKKLNGELLKKPYIDLWSEKNPTFGYCYILSESLYHYIDKDVRAFCINMGELGNHWYVTINGSIVDFTGEQFKDPIDYSKGVGKGFLKGSIETNKGYISKRGYQMAKYLGLIK